MLKKLQKQKSLLEKEIWKAFVDDDEAGEGGADSTQQTSNESFADTSVSTGKNDLSLFVYFVY